MRAIDGTLPSVLINANIVDPFRSGLSQQVISWIGFTAIGGADLASWIVQGRFAPDGPGVIDNFPTLRDEITDIVVRRNFGNNFADDLSCFFFRDGVGTDLDFDLGILEIDGSVAFRLDDDFVTRIHAGLRRFSPSLCRWLELFAQACGMFLQF